MKRFFYFSVIILALASCKKDPNDYIAKDTRNLSSSTSSSADTVKTQTVTPVPPSGTFTSVTSVIPTQTASMKLDQNTLNIVYTENITILTQTADLQKSWAVHFKEDFSASDLGNFDYHSLTREGVNAFDWVDDNLNNINKTVSDTLINNVPVTKIEVIRTFNFTHTYGTVQQATAEYNTLLTETQNITFSAYYTPTNPNANIILGTAKLTYIAGK